MADEGHIPRAEQGGPSPQGRLPRGQAPDRTGELPRQRPVPPGEVHGIPARPAGPGEAGAQPGYAYDPAGQQYGPGEPDGRPGQVYGRPGQVYGRPGLPHEVPAQAHGITGQAHGVWNEPYGTPGQPHGLPGGPPYDQPYRQPGGPPYGEPDQPYGQPGPPYRAGLAAFPARLPAGWSPRRSWHTLLITVIAGVVALAVGVGTFGLRTLRSSGGDRSGGTVSAPGRNAAAAHPQPAAPVPPAIPSVSGEPKPFFFDNSLSTSVFGTHIRRRSQDAKPLTLPEIFDQTSMYGQPVYNSERLTLAAKDLTPECAVTVWGPRLKRDLNAAGCTQVARGMYVSKDRQYIAMLAVFNLRDNTAVRAVAHAMGPAAMKNNLMVKTHQGKDGFVLPLAVNPAAKLGRNQDNECLAMADGHLLVIEWAQGPGKVSQEDDFRLDRVQDAIDSVTWFVTVRDNKAMTAP